MLRTARSMPSLRVLNAVVKSDIQQQSKAFSSAASKYHLVSPNIPDYKHDALKYQTFNRAVHQTSQKSQTPLLNKKSEFSLMSLNTLKSECRKRGLKISGRKSELVSRISTYDSSYSTKTANAMSTQVRPKTNVQAQTQSQSIQATSQTIKRFSNSSKVEAKGDTSHIDFIKPVDMTPPKLVEDDYIIQIPSLSTDASKKAVTELEKQLSHLPNPNETVVSKAPGSDSTIFEQGSVEDVAAQNAEALETDASDLLGEYVEEQKAEPYEYEYKSVSRADKRFLGGFLAAVGLWWFVPTGKKSKKEHNKEEPK